MEPNRLHVAVVDDDRAVLKALGRLLQAAGFAVSTFDSGRDFLGAALRPSPDVVILDVHMPELTGFDVQKQIRAENVHLPVILISALDDHDWTAEQRSLRARAQGFLRKPFTDLQLLKTIESATAGAK